MKTIGGVAHFSFSHFSVGRLFLIDCRAPGGHCGSLLGTLLGFKINLKNKVKQGGQQKAKMNLFHRLTFQTVAHWALGAGPLDMIYRTYNATKTGPHVLTRRGPLAQRILMPVKNLEFVLNVFFLVFLFGGDVLGLSVHLLLVSRRRPFFCTT